MNGYEICCAIGNDMSIQQKCICGEACDYMVHLAGCHAVCVLTIAGCDLYVIAQSLCDVSE